VLQYAGKQHGKQPLRDRARAAAREKQRNEQKGEELASNNIVQLNFVIAIAGFFFPKLGFESTYMQSVTYS